MKNETVREKQILKNGDILLAASTGSKKVIGKAAQFGNPEVRTFGAFCKVLRPKKGVDKTYFRFFFATPYYRNTISSVVNGANINNLSTRDLDNLKIPLPPLPIQQKIAEVLDTADRIRRRNQQILEKYDQLAQSVFLEMFGDPVKNEKGWEVKSLDDLTNLITDGKHGNCTDKVGSGYFFISAKDIFNDQINYLGVREIPKDEFEEVDRRTNLQPGDLVMVNTGATIGKMAIASNKPETRRTTFQKSVAIIKVKQEQLSTTYLKYLFGLRLDSYSSKGSGSAVKNLLLSEMRRFNIMVPPLDLQNQFSSIIEKIEQQKQQAKTELDKSEELFQSLMQGAFRGELEF